MKQRTYNEAASQLSAKIEDLLSHARGLGRCGPRIEDGLRQGLGGCFLTFKVREGIVQSVFLCHMVHGLAFEVPSTSCHVHNSMKT